jgi:hypothetical protein
VGGPELINGPSPAHNGISPIAMNGAAGRMRSCCRGGGTMAIIGSSSRISTSRPSTFGRACRKIARPILRRHKCSSIAILDFGLTAAPQCVLSGALDLVAEGTRYSLREIAGTMWAMRHPGWCPRENRLAQEQAFIVPHLSAMSSVLPNRAEALR